MANINETINDSIKKLDGLKTERLELIQRSQCKPMSDVKELVNIKNKYQDVIDGKPKKQGISLYTTSRYIKAYCSSKNCPCREQEKILNESLRNLPSDASKCNPRLVSEEFSPQILSWASTIYECVPCLRSSCKMIATSNFLYVFGGSNPNISKKALQDVYRFNILTRRWKKLLIKNLPTSLISYAICWSPNPKGDNLVGYLFGGANDPEGVEMSDKLYKFSVDPEGFINFQEIEVYVTKDTKNPSPRCGSSMVMDNDEKLYLIGGVDKKCYWSDVFILDTKAKKLEWIEVELSYNAKDTITPKIEFNDEKSYSEDLKHEPMLESNNRTIAGRYTHETVIINERILLLGGGNGEWSASFDKIDAFDIKKQEFVKIQTEPDALHGYPQPRQFHSAVKNGNDAYIIGGWSDDNETYSIVGKNATIYSDVWKLSFMKSENGEYYKWTKTSTILKNPLFFHCSSITPEGCIYTFGGCIDAKSMYPSNKLQRFWIKPPELKHISIFKIVSNMPKLVDEFKKHEIERLLEEKRQYKKLLNDKKKDQSENKSDKTKLEIEEREENLSEEIEQNLCELLQTLPSRLFSVNKNNNL